jgi:hypothetical protein
MEPEIIGAAVQPSESVIHAVVEVLKLIEAPTLIVAIIVVFLMYRLLLRRERTIENGFTNVYNELHANTKLLSEFSGTTKALIEMIKTKRGRDESDN